MNEQKARELLQVDAEFSTLQLKSNYRRASFLAHPDAGGSNEKFIELQVAYNLLLPQCSTDPTDRQNKVLKTVDGALLSNLGKGYPLTESARTCTTCEGRGYKEYNDYKFVEKTCSACAGTGILFLKCRECSGLGYFRNPQTGKNVGSCENCAGTGRFYPKPKYKPTIFHSLWEHLLAKYIDLPDGRRLRVNTCKVCQGSGVQTQKEKINVKIYHRCTECDGVGEIKMWNPVIPRGFLKSS